jgi:hypothetical protein
VRASASLLLIPFLLNGCYSYVPARSGPPGQGSRIRIHLSEPQDVRLTHVTGNEIVLVGGELVRLDADTATLSAYSLRARSGYEFLGTGETVRIPRRVIASVEEHRISPAKTVVLAGVVALGSALLATAVQSGGSEGRGPGNAGQGQ